MQCSGDLAGSHASNEAAVHTATGVLTLADTYTPGTTVTTADFISLSYSFVVPDDLAFIEVFPAFYLRCQVRLLSGMSMDFQDNNSGLNACAEQGLIVKGAGSIDCVTAGWWYVEFFPVGIGDDGGDFNDRDHGTTHTWTLRTVSVPEPSTLGLLAVGLLG